MDTETLNIALPAAMKSFIQEQVATGGYRSASEYVRRLVREDQHRRVREEIDRQLLEALQSGPARPMTPEFWEERRQELQRRLEQPTLRNPE